MLLKDDGRFEGEVNTGKQERERMKKRVEKE